MKNFIEFLSLTAICAGLGIDNGLLVELSLRSLKLEEKKHLLWRSIALALAAGLRVFMLFILSSLEFLKNPLPHSVTEKLRLFNEHAEELTWMNVTFFVGGFGEEHDDDGAKGGPIDAKAVAYVAGYLLLMNIIFSLDSVFSAVAMMNIETQFWWIVAAILSACVIMIVGMVPLSRLIMKSRHFSVTMLVVLILIAAKLLVDGVGGHFPNSVLILLLVAIFGNDAAQAFFDKAAEKRLQDLEAEAA